jgi:DNA gyrase subunit A
MELIKEELLEVKKKFADRRRTEITSDEGELTLEDLIAEESMVITVSHRGYIKRTPTNTYSRQHRGGVGRRGADPRDEDFVEHLFTATTHEYFLVLTQRGRCYWLKVHEIPQAGAAARGKPIVNLVQVPREDAVAALLPVKAFDDEHSLMMATEKGTVKKSSLAAFANPRAGGIIAMGVPEGDRLLSAEITDGTNDVIMVTAKGQSIRFHESDVREMGRGATGVRGISLRQGDRVVGMVVVKRDGTLLVVTENGYGKRSRFSDYRVQSRGGIGIKTVKVAEKTGRLVAAKEVVDQDELMAITASGMIIRMSVQGLRVLGRDTQGVRMIRLGAGDRVVDVAQLAEESAGAPALPALAEGNGDGGDGAGETGRARGARGSGRRAKMEGEDDEGLGLFEGEDEEEE